MANKKILLIEPGYRNKYPPLGLMKLAQYHGPRGKNDFVTFVKGCDKSALSSAWDRIYVTTLFSFEYKKISEAIDFAIVAAKGQRNRVFVGGIAASLMPDRFRHEERWSGIRFITGLLTDSPAKALQLDQFEGELYSEDVSASPIEDEVPDYSILDHVSYRYPVNDAYFLYASRGCIRSCSFCGVPKLEGAQRAVKPISDTVRSIAELYGEKKDLILMDNNVVAASDFKSIIAEIRNLGFTPGASLKRNNRTYLRRVDFNQGVDARILCKDEIYLRELASIAISPLRIAFDLWGLRSQYRASVELAAKFGLINLSNYMLYNFHDSPNDLYQRMNLNVELNEAWGIRIWSFPMRYQPTDFPDRSFIGEHWNRFFLRSMQIVLQATHGVVSGEPAFFRHAFGNDEDSFTQLLSQPHHFTFNRHWYTMGDGADEREAFLRKWRSISASERKAMLVFLSRLNPSHYELEIEKISGSPLKSILRYYVPPAKEKELEIWRLSKEIVAPIDVPEDERVEDAGLDERDLYDAMSLGKVTA